MMVRDPQGMSLVELLDERQYLLTLAATCLRSARLAEQVVCRTYQRWFGLSPHDRAQVGAPRMWLASVAAGLCTEFAGTVAAPVRDARYPFGDVDIGGNGPSVANNTVVQAFSAACTDDDEPGLDSLLARSVTVVVDGGGGFRIDPAGVCGAPEASRFLRGLLARQPEITVDGTSVNGAAGLVVRRGTRVVAVLSPEVVNGRVCQVWLVLNPGKLSGWNRT